MLRHSNRTVITLINRLRSRSAAALSVAVLAVGCSSSSDQSEGDSSELRKRHTDTENQATLTVQLPTGYCEPGGNCAHALGAPADVRLDGSQAIFPLGQKTRLKAGEHTLAVNGALWSTTLSRGDNRVVVLPIVHRKMVFATLPTVRPTEFGRLYSPSYKPLNNDFLPRRVEPLPVKPTIELVEWSTNDSNWGCERAYNIATLAPGTASYSCDALARTGTDGHANYLRLAGTQCKSVQNRNGRPRASELCSSYVDGDLTFAGIQERYRPQVTTLFAEPDFAFAPGTYSSSETGAFDVAEGETREVTIPRVLDGTIPETFATTITLIDGRQLPDAAVTTIASSCTLERSFAFASTGIIPPGFVRPLLAFKSPRCNYTFTASGRSIPLDQDSANQIALRRLDVDDVEVTKEDGTTYNARGKYELYFGGNKIAGPFDTNTGIDVLPGTYEFVLSYTTADGAKTHRETMVF